MNSDIYAAWEKIKDGLRFGDGCWIWDKHVSGGYGRVFVNGGRYLSHRVSYMVNVDTDCDGRIVQTYGNKLCVNPDHLELQDEETRFWNMVDKGNDCWEWQGTLNPGGYGMFVSSECGLVLAHRFSWELRYGVIPDIDGRTGTICHSCDNTRCVNPHHLFLGTQADNIADAAIKGRIARGSRSGRSVLTEDDIPIIKGMISNGVSYVETSRKFGVNAETIREIAIGKTWAWLE